MRPTWPLPCASKLAESDILHLAPGPTPTTAATAVRSPTRPSPTARRRLSKLATSGTSPSRTSRVSGCRPAPARTTRRTQDPRRPTAPGPAARRPRYVDTLSAIFCDARRSKQADGFTLGSADRPRRGAGRPRHAPRPSFAELPICAVQPSLRVGQQDEHGACLARLDSSRRSAC